MRPKLITLLLICIAALSCQKTTAPPLYVLKGDAYLRVSVGGPSDKASQTRARMLAQKAIARL